MTLPTVAEYFAQYLKHGHIFPAPGLRVRLGDNSIAFVWGIAPRYVELIWPVLPKSGHAPWTIFGRNARVETNGVVYGEGKDFNDIVAIYKDGQLVAGGAKPMTQDLKDLCFIPKDTAISLLEILKANCNAYTAFEQQDLEKALAQDLSGLRLAQDWQPIETAPSDVEFLLYCPDRGITNEARIEIGVYTNTKAGVRHAWATHWMPLPAAPGLETEEK